MDWKDVLGKLDLPPGDDQPVEDPVTVEKKKETLRVIIDKKGRKGKVATIIEGFDSPDDEVAAVAADLKRRLGVGGSSRGGEILIQGDCATRVRELLAAQGYKVK